MPGIQLHAQRVPPGLQVLGDLDPQRQECRRVVGDLDIVDEDGGVELQPVEDELRARGHLVELDVAREGPAGPVYPLGGERPESLLDRAEDALALEVAMHLPRHDRVESHLREAGGRLGIGSPAPVLVPPAEPPGAAEIQRGQCTHHRVLSS